VSGGTAGAIAPASICAIRAAIAVFPVPGPPVSRNTRAPAPSASHAPIASNTHCRPVKCRVRSSRKAEETFMA